ncbi:ATP-binding cassette domain-containing protein [Phycicoccus sp. BSK3Z-2]|uniref:ATP-binding cassette domain-containing protein n=1 Tax=Phycicoccus avicenniae TaxID=2828860 RepID=A0A941I0T4_9MICO|nr:ATP-binding cassette domain-containing protein [Phycicoccus avicenniae]MBR7744245.1 ATP-binding cassette domain-containing protein [Phycicoccus avicenniae]
MLEIRNLTRRFGGVTAVDGVTFDVPAGQLTGFVGGNGAGKTTTMRMVMGVLGVDGGEVLWQGHPVTPEDQRRFGYMPEERGLYPKQRVIDQLVYLAELKGMGPRPARAAAEEHLERLGLGGRATDRLEALSLGNQQRVQVAAALLHDPVALVLDEPFSGLDPVAVDSMVDLLRERVAGEVPVLFSSHQLDLVEALCDRLVILSGGRVVATGAVEDLRSQGPLRYRVRLDADAGWVRDLRGLHVVDVDGPLALVEVVDPGGEQALLREATRRGAVHEFTPVRPAVADIYREVAA